MQKSILVNWKTLTSILFKNYQLSQFLSKKAIIEDFIKSITKILQL